MVRKPVYALNALGYHSADFLINSKFFIPPQGLWGDKYYDNVKLQMCMISILLSRRVGAFFRSASLHASPYKRCYCERKNEYSKDVRNRLTRNLGHLARIKEMVGGGEDFERVMMQMKAVRSAHRHCKRDGCRAGSKRSYFGS